MQMFLICYALENQGLLSANFAHIEVVSRKNRKALSQEITKITPANLLPPKNVIC